jgi:anti-anti-sigma factor
VEGLARTNPPDLPKNHRRSKKKSASKKRSTIYHAGTGPKNWRCQTSRPIGGKIEVAKAMEGTTVEIETRQSRDILIVDMAGRLDSSTSGTSYDKMVGIAKSGAKRIILNLDKLEFVTSAGLRVILTMAKLLQSVRGEMKICNTRAPVREVLESSGFNSLIRIFDDEKSAIQSWN